MSETISDITFNEPVVLSLFDYSTNMVDPWARNGYDTIAVDLKHDSIGVEDRGEGRVITLSENVMNFLPPKVEYKIVFAFPPCTNLAVSGARWFKDKGLEGLSDGIKLVEQSRKICEWSNAPWMIENPVSTLSTYWRDPDYIFHPYEYDGYTENDDTYTKKTCLWLDERFKIPEMDYCEIDEFDDRIHKMAPSENRSEKRSETPMGFSKAVYEANV